MINTSTAEKTYTLKLSRDEIATVCDALFRFGWYLLDRDLSASQSWALQERIMRERLDVKEQPE